MPVFQIAPNALTNRSTSSMPWSNSSTLWPSDSSSLAVASTASMHAGATSMSTGGVSTTPMRSDPGERAASAANGSADGGALYQASGSGRPITSSTAAESATVRATTPLDDSPSRLLGPLGTRLRLGFSPTRPQHDDGMRIEPPPSLAWAIGAMPDATAEAAPPLDPPGVWSGFHGLRVTPRASLSVKETAPNSGVAVLLKRTKPASSNRSTTSSLSARGSFEAPFEPWLVGQPATSLRSLIGIGTPWNGPSSSAGVDATASVACRAAARTRSSSRKQKALSCGSSRSTRSRYSSVTSIGLTSLRRMAAAISRAEENGSTGGRLDARP